MSIINQKLKKLNHSPFIKSIISSPPKILEKTPYLPETTSILTNKSFT